MKTLTLDSHGARIRLRAPHSIATRLCGQVSDYAQVGGEGPVDAAFVVVPDGVDRFRLCRRDGHTEMVGTEDEVIVGFVDRVHPLVARNARTAMFVHAAAFAWGRAVVVVPGRSHSGKSSLVAEALASGARYFSDEFAVFDDDGLLHPYARPLSLRGREGPRRFATAAELGGTVATEPARPVLVVSTRYEPGRRWDPRVVEGSSAALPLIDNTVMARSDPRRMLRITSRVASRVTTLVGPRGEAGETVAALRVRAMEAAEGVPA
ncbi:MAG: hypothetical protein RIE08_01995 [Acidimicrobiales bacterium]